MVNPSTFVTPYADLRPNGTAPTAYFPPESSCTHLGSPTGVSGWGCVPPRCYIFVCSLLLWLCKPLRKGCVTTAGTNRQNGAPPKTQRSGFGWERRSKGAAVVFASRAETEVSGLCDDAATAGSFSRSGSWVVPRPYSHFLEKSGLRMHWQRGARRPETGRPSGGSQRGNPFDRSLHTFCRTRKYAAGGNPAGRGTPPERPCGDGIPKNKIV